MAEATPSYDVVVVGAGNAALCAALAAHEEGAGVLVLEKAPKHLRGGNSAFTGGGFRFAYNDLNDVRKLLPDLSDAEAGGIEVGSYPQSQYYDDLQRVTEGNTDPEMAETLVSDSFPTMQWLEQTGMRWVLMYGRQAYRVGDKLRFWGGLIVEAIGGGQGLSDQLFGLCERREIDVRYDTKAVSLIQDDQGAITGLRIRGPEGFSNVNAKAVVLAAGGFEANPEWRTRYLGAGWEFAKVRGTRYNTGDGIKMALDAGAQPFGNWSGCHAVAWDLNAPPFGDLKIGDLFQKHSYPLGLIVNTAGKRFVDEGADFRNCTYAKYGRAILAQPERTAFQLFDSKVMDMLRDEYRIARITKAMSDTIEGLADALGIDREGLVETVREYNAAVQDTEF